MSFKKTFLLMFFFLASFIIITPLSIAMPSLPRVFLDPSTLLDKSLVPGTQFTINMSLDSIESNLLWAYQLTLSFNPDVLQGVSVDNGPFLGSKGGEVIVISGQGFNNTAGTLWLFGAYIDPIKRLPSGGSDEYGPLATITFEVADYGGSPITLGPETALINSTGRDIIRKKDDPDSFFDGYFDNRPPISINPEIVRMVPVGESFTINVTAGNIEDLYSWEFYLNWSAPLLNVTSVVEGDFLKSQPDGTVFYQEMHNDEGYIYAKCTRTGVTGVTGSGTLANITFLVEDEGNSTLHLYDTVILNSTQEEMLHMLSHGYFNNLKVHNIGVTNVTASPSIIKFGSGDPIYINVTVENNGAFPENFNVTIYFGEEEIGMWTDISLDSGANITLTFTWDTTGVEMGEYSIKAVASLVAEEAYKNDNTRLSEKVLIAVRNIGIVSGITSAFRVDIGDSVMIGVRIVNRGSVATTFNVTVYHNETAIGTETIYELSFEDSASVTMTWNITDVEPGLYLIKAATSIIPDDVDMSDNVFNLGVIDVRGASETSSSLQIVSITAIAVVVVSAATIVYRRTRRSPEEVW